MRSVRRTSISNASLHYRYWSVCLHLCVYVDIYMGCVHVCVRMSLSVCPYVCERIRIGQCIDYNEQRRSMLRGIGCVVV
uniref:Secreted protein n=1 Tax=Parascaris univalens TaxID=6257 RepID=A0A915AQE4_PARUN